MRDRYHTYDLAQSRNLLKMACVHMSARGRRRKRHRSVTGGAVAPGATGHPPLGTPEPPRAAPEAHGAPNGANLAARVRAPVTATCMAHTTRAHGRLTAHRCGANACAASTRPHTPGRVLGGGCGGLLAASGASNGRQPTTGGAREPCRRRTAAALRRLPHLRA